MILYINACTRKESRTDRLARFLLKKLGAFEEINLYEENLAFMNENKLLQRAELLKAGDYENPMFILARQFASAETIVISAPYWDLSFPAVLKAYFENIYVTGIVSRYGSDGKPHGLCKARKLYYVTTAGGPYDSTYSYGYIHELATRYFGISKAELIAAEMLDVDGFDPEQILQRTESEISARFDGQNIF